MCFYSKITPCRSWGFFLFVLSLLISALFCPGHNSIITINYYNYAAPTVGWFSREEELGWELQPRGTAVSRCAQSHLRLAASMQQQLQAPSPAFGSHHWSQPGAAAGGTQPAGQPQLNPATPGKGHSKEAQWMPTYKQTDLVRSSAWKAYCPRTWAAQLRAKH